MARLVESIGFSCVQSAADTFTSKKVATHTGGKDKTALLLKRIEMRLNPSVQTNWNFGQDIGLICNLSRGKDAPTSKVLINDLSTLADFTVSVNAIQNGTVMPCSLDWFSPPGLVVTDEFLHISVWSFATSVANDVYGRMWFTRQQISDLEFLKLSAGKR
jgi:hypothetical protein